MTKDPLWLRIPRAMCQGLVEPLFVFAIIVPIGPFSWALSFLILNQVKMLALSVRNRDASQALPTCERSKISFCNTTLETIELNTPRGVRCAIVSHTKL